MSIEYYYPPFCPICGHVMVPSRRNIIRCNACRRQLYNKQRYARAKAAKFAARLRTADESEAL